MKPNKLTSLQPVNQGVTYHFDQPTQNHFQTKDHENILREHITKTFSIIWVTDCAKHAYAYVYHHPLCQATLSDTLPVHDTTRDPKTPDSRYTMIQAAVHTIRCTWYSNGHRSTQTLQTSYTNRQTTHTNSHTPFCLRCKLIFQVLRSTLADTVHQ
jgi:hypothetical protein